MFILMLLIYCLVGSSKGSSESSFEENLRESFEETTQATTVTVKMEKCNGTELIIDLQKVDKEYNYYPTDEERQFAYKVAFAEAITEDELGIILVINSAINMTKECEYSSIIEEFTTAGRYSSVKDGQIYLITNESKRLVTEEDLTQELKDAVDEAFRKDYSEELLKQKMEEVGLNDSKYYEGGSLYFYNPEAVSSSRSNERQFIKVSFQHGNHVFYRYWNKSEDDF